MDDLLTIEQLLDLDYNPDVDTNRVFTDGDVHATQNTTRDNRVPVYEP